MLLSKMLKTLIKTKLLQGKYLELRGYELNKYPLKIIVCSSQDYSKCSHLGEPYQILTLAQQKKGHIVNTQTSKFYPYKNYLMLKFVSR